MACGRCKNVCGTSNDATNCENGACCVPIGGVCETSTGFLPCCQGTADNVVCTYFGSNTMATCVG